jgi:CBS domain-containing protein
MTKQITYLGTGSDFGGLFNMELVYYIDFLFAKETIMKIGDLIKSKPAPITINSLKTIQQAMRLLIENKIGSLIVVEDDANPIGIITERDIFHLAFRYRGDMMDMKVVDNMTGRLILGKPEDDIDYVAELLTENRIRHLPVIDDNNELCGIVSIGDILKAKFENILVKGNEETA